MQSIESKETSRNPGLGPAELSVVKANPASRFYFGILTSLTSRLLTLAPGPSIPAPY
jgi:hypothetical protein